MVSYNITQELLSPDSSKHIVSSEYIIPTHSVILSTSDVYGNITSCNESFVMVSGYHYDELIGKAHHILRHPETPPDLFSDLWHTIKQGRAWFGVIKNQRKNGDHYWVAANVSPIFEGDKIKGYVSVRYPATDAQKAQAAQTYYNGQAFPITAAPKIPYLFAISVLAALGVAGILLPMLTNIPMGLGHLLTLCAIPVGFMFYIIASKPNRRQAQAIRDLSCGQFHDPFQGNDHWTAAINLLRIRIAQNSSDQFDINDRQEKRFAETLALLEEAIIEIDLTGNITYQSDSWHILTEPTKQSSNNIIDHIHPDSREIWLQHITTLTRLHKPTFQCYFQLNAVHGTPIWIDGRFFSHTNPQGQVSIRGVLRDSTQKHLHETHLTHIALHDNLTGLANRVLLEDRTSQAIRMVQRTDSILAIIFFDIDHFKHINDNLGHQAGDLLLVAVTERLSHCLRPHDTFARWGGDEFIILVEQLHSQNDIHVLTEKLNAAMLQPFLLVEQSIKVALSIGVACYPYDGEDNQTLYTNADKAMYQAKRNGRNQACFYQNIKHSQPV